MKKYIRPGLLLLMLMLLGGCGRTIVAHEPAATPSLSSYLIASRRDPEGRPVGLPTLETDSHTPYMSALLKNYFYPDRPVTRVQLCRILYPLMTNPVEGSCRFSDMPETDPDYEAVACLTAWGIFTDSDGEFRPDDMLSRAQLVSILSRFYPAPGDTDALPRMGSFLKHRLTVEKPAEPTPAFTDIAGHWAQAAIQNAADRGWIEAGGKFYPDAAVTRSELCRILNRVLDRNCDEAAVILMGSYSGFTDVPSTNSFYGDIMEATQEHSYIRDENGVELWPCEALEPGFHRVLGRLYYVKEDGTLFRNEDYGLLHFDENGRYTTGLPELDDAIAEIFLELGTDDMSQSEALREAYLYCTHDHVYINHNWYSYGFTDYYNDQFPRRALKFIQTGGGQCYDYAACFGLMARNLGYYDAYIVKAEVNQYYAPHGWVVIPEDGVNYIYDPELESTRPGRHADFGLYAIENFDVYSYWYTPWW